MMSSFNITKTYTDSLSLLSQGSVNTAIGTFSTDFGSFINKVVSIAVGIAGVVAVFLLSQGAFTILTSSGDPEKLMEGREMITNALMGLVLVVLSVVVLQWLGWDILNIGGFTGVSWGQVGN
ncbi:hypothetical protein JW887_06595 [Candidatus Dojkabacteria bacterium]|nr:hypothetical protein [Candidatus Dojkabacteria bacterium]